MKWFIAIFCWMVSVAVFYGMFFKLAPYICTLIPAGQWQGLLKVGTYFFIAYFGGIGIPLFLIVVSIMMLRKSNFDNF
jgi:hypothetical protein